MLCLIYNHVPASQEPSLVAFRIPCATRLDRRADLALSEGQHGVAERLSEQAAAIRARLSGEVVA